MSANAVEATNVKKLSKYEVTGVLGRGGMGVVYLAEDKRIGRQVAIKTLTEGYAGQPGMLERFYREAQAGILHHPNIVIVYDLGDENGIPMIVMEFVAGEPLDKLILSDRKLRLAEKLGIIEQVCCGLAYAHRNGVIHRDIKPGNVIVQPEGNVKIVDFGIARLQDSNADTGLTVAGSVIGTVHYVAPERLKGEPFDGRSDIFSTGVMLYLLLTGQLPFGGETLAVMHKLVYEPFPPLKNFLSDYPPELDAILDRAMAKDPDQRYATADEFANDLGSIRQQLNQARASELFSDAERLNTEQQFGQARDVLLQLTKIDAQHTGARQLLGIVQLHLARMHRLEQAKHFKAQADQALESGRITEAIATLQQAAKLDPESATVQIKLDTAKERKRRQEEINSLLTEAEASRGRGDITGALRALEKALPLDPDNSRLRSAHAIIAKEAKLAEQRKHVRGLLDQAREEISACHFTQAIEILRETSQIDPTQEEVGPLLQSAIAGQEEERRRKLLEEVHGEVEVCLASEDFERAREFLSYGLERTPGDASLLQLRTQVEEQSHAARQQQLAQENARRAKELEFVNFQVTQLRSSGDLTEAVRFLAGQPPAIADDPRIAELLRELEHDVEVEQATQDTLKAATLDLDRRDYAAGWEKLHGLQRAHGDNPAMHRAMADYQRRCTAAADRAVAEVMQQARSALRSGDAANAIPILQTATETLRFASKQQEQEWNDMVAEATQAVARAKAAAETEAHARAAREAAQTREAEAREAAQAAQAEAKAAAKIEAAKSAAAAAAQAEAAKAADEAAAQATLMPAPAETQTAIPRASLEAQPAQEYPPAGAEPRPASPVIKKQAAPKLAIFGGIAAIVLLAAGGLWFFTSHKASPPAPNNSAALTAPAGSVPAIPSAPAQTEPKSSPAPDATQPNAAAAPASTPPPIQPEAAASPLAFSCSVSPAEVDPGDKIVVTSTAAMLDRASKPAYKFTSTGGKVLGRGATATIATAGLSPGHYGVTGHVSEGGKGGQSADCTATFTVRGPDDQPEEAEAETAPPPAPKPGDPTGDFIVTNGSNQSKSSLTIQPGSTTTLKWDISSAASVALDKRVVPAKGQQEVSPTSTTSYTLVAMGKKGNNTLIRTVTVSMALPSPPQILSFVVETPPDEKPGWIRSGEKANLKWRVKDVKSVTIEGVGTFDPSKTDHVEVSPTTRTKYLMKATGEGGEVYAPEVYLSVLPR